MASTSDSVPENSFLIDQFCSVTGSDSEKAREMLEVCNWNLEMAVNMHVDSYQENGDNNETAAAAAVNGAVDSEGVRAPIPQSRAVLVDEDSSFLYNLRSRKRRPHSVFDGFRDFQAEAEFQGQADGGANNSEHFKKQRTLEDLFRPPLDLMHRGNFESARDCGQVTNKWLMVNIQDSQEFACQVLNRDVWSNAEVKKLISHNFVFWQVYSDSVDGERYMQFYKPVEFPYIAVLDPRTGEKLIVWHNVDITSICKLIDSFIHEHSTPDGSSTITNNPASSFSLLDQSEEDQLKAAMAASVEETTMVNVEDNESDIETFDSDSECNGTKPPKPVIHSDQSSDTIDVVGLERTESNGKDSVEDEETWRDFLGSEDDPKSDLVLRLPDGKREQISWPCTTKVKSLLLFIGELGYDPGVYELVTNYPRRNLCQLDLCKTLKEVDLFPREMIFVQMKA